MKCLVGQPSVNGLIYWDYYGPNTNVGTENEICIKMTFSSRMSERDTVKSFISLIEINNIQWIRYLKPNWILSSQKFKNQFQNFIFEDWFFGDIAVEPVYEVVAGPVSMGGMPSQTTNLSFFLTPEIVMEQTPKKIFLSHKSINKDMVREFKKTLEVVSLEPWLDEDEMPAGTEIHRGIQEGIEKSCAVVFFITPDFEDERFLHNEINYAITQKTKKRSRFAIITLVFKDQDGKVGEIPSSLREYIFKEPNSYFEAFREIIRALPLKIPPAIWRDS